MNIRNKIINMPPIPYNKKIKYFFSFVFVFLAVLCVSYNANAAESISKRLSGKILIQVESKGEAWYVNPDGMKRYYLGRPEDAFNMMRELGLGISEKDYWGMNKNKKAPAKLAGKILLRVQEHGEAYYVNPTDLNMYYLGTPKDAFDMMRERGLGVANKDLEKIKIGKSVEEVIEDRKNQPVKVDELKQNMEKREKMEAMEKANCVYEKGCYLYKGVMIKWTVDTDTFPPDWVADKERINPSAESLTDKDEIDRSIRVLKKAMDKYPEYFFADAKNKIKAVHVLNYMFIFHRNYAATLSIPDRKLYISGSFDNDASFEQAFHHEYSHLLYWRNYDNFSEQEWDSVNPGGFQYDKKSGGSGFKPELAEAGFLIAYSKSNREEDFANIAEQIFKKEDKFLWGNFWQIVSQYPKIRQKTDMIINFYHKLDPMFTEEYFRKIGNE